MTLAQTEISVPQLERYAALIYRRAGIRISAQKTALLSNRLRRRMRKTSIENFDDYYDLLSRLPENDPEWDLFLQEITTHETYLFRDEVQWDWLRQTYLPQIARDAAQGLRPATLRVWSAACSTGDEAMTIASCIVATLPGISSWKVEILGTDIGIGAVEQASQVTFNERAMQFVPADYRQRFFRKLPEASVWQAKPQIASLATFRQHNLMDLLRVLPFDLVFLKNVLIYFDRDSKRTVLENVRKLLKPGAMLVAGGSEGVSELLRDFKQPSPWLFQAPDKK
jgi:chemotaxis protein methyltransferase CheR